MSFGDATVYHNWNVTRFEHLPAQILQEDPQTVDTSVVSLRHCALTNWPWPPVPATNVRGCVEIA